MLNNALSKPVLRLSIAILVNENIFKLPSLLCKDISRRNFARWSTRKPSKVFVPDDDVSLGSLDSKEFYQSEYENTKSEENKQPKYYKKSDNELLEQQSSSKTLNYQVLEDHDSTFSQLMTNAGNRKMRRKNNLMMLEGKRLNLDALQAGLKPKKLFFTQKSILEELNLSPNSNIPLYKIPYKSVQLWSKLETPPGIIGFYNIPKDKDIVPVDTLPIKVLCDNVRDPGNMGSIIRVAASVGCTQILLVQGCTDPWDSKVLRSAAGGHFHIPIKMDLKWGEKDLVQSSDHIFLADSHTSRNQNDLPLLPYHDIDVSKSKSVLVIIGGETEGLSNEALNLATQHGGSRLYIPLSNRVESLNSGCALSVILFEIKRHFLLNGFIKNSKKEHSSNCDNDLVSARSSS